MNNKINNKTNFYKEMINVKKVLSIVLSIIMMFSSVFAASFSAFAYNSCQCCSECTGDDDCVCGCTKCNYCGDSGDCNDCYNDDDCGDSGDCNDCGDDEEDNTNKSNLSYNYDPLVEGSDPVEKATVYKDSEKTADLENIFAYQYCGDSMFWYIRSKTLYIFGRGRMYRYDTYSQTPWAGKTFDRVVVRTNVNSITANAFNGAGIESLVLPSTVEEIGEYAFANCKNLKEVKLGMDMKKVGSHAFYNCTALEMLTLNNELQFLGASAFENCESLVSVRFPSTIEVVETAAFKNCKSLKKAKLRTGLVEIKADAFSGCSMLSDVNFPNTVTTIGDRAFNDCNSIKHVVFGDRVNSIGDCAFAKTHIESVIIKPEVKRVAASVFDGCSFVEVNVYKNATVYKTLKPKTNLHVICADHEYEALAKVKANFSRNGIGGGYKCKACEEVISSNTIARISNVTLKKTTFAYNGKAQFPDVKAVDINNKNISSKYYTKTCSAGSCNVGTYYATVTFTGDYEGSKTLSYTINPAKPTLSKLTAQSKAVKVEWKKQTAQVTGFKIQYSVNKNFSGAKTVTISKNSTTSTTISKLSAKKKYYVRMRVYKTVNGKNYYSEWSKTKSKTTKK